MQHHLDTFLATPAVYQTGMEKKAWEQELRLMIERALFTRSFIDGEICPVEFSDLLADRQYDPYELHNIWEDGSSLL